MSDIKYGDASLKAREFFASRVTSQLNKNVGDYGLRFIKLTNLIPNWETYLTVKQLEAAKRYLKCLNAYDVDYQLKLSSGTTHQRLFGSKTSKGALGRLEEVNKRLEASGFFEQQQKRKEAIQHEAKVNKKIKLSDKSIEKVRELIRLVVEMRNIESHLTKSQVDKIHTFMRVRNFRKAADECGVTVSAFQRALIGDGGALEKLKSVQESRTINSWEEI